MTLSSSYLTPQATFAIVCFIFLISEVRPVTPPGEKEKETKHFKFRGERKISVANADLLMKLFEGVEKQMERENKRETKKGITSLRHVPAHHIKAIRGR